MREPPQWAFCFGFFRAAKAAPGGLLLLRGVAAITAATTTPVAADTAAADTATSDEKESPARLRRDMARSAPEAREPCTPSTAFSRRIS